MYVYITLVEHALWRDLLLRFCGNKVAMDTESSPGVRRHGGGNTHHKLRVHRESFESLVITVRTTP